MGERMWVLVAVLCLGAGVVIGLVVGGWRDDEEPADPARIPVQEAETVDVTLTEHEITPDDVEVRAGVIEFVVRNEGDERHVLVVESSNDESRSTKRLDPGETDSVKADLRPGDYVMYDPLGDNRERGMEGEVHVEPRETDTRTVTDVDTETETDTRIATETETETERRTETKTETETETETQTQTVTETETVTVPRRR